jgi:phenylpropionate dioxygenase-like ring-hydroxylating dioxygenase large terminal subunit
MEGAELTRVGPGTVMGELMRQYWIPAAMSSELKAGGAPLRLLLLGERLIGFRDSAGKVGVMDHRCPHRCASLFLGRNEGNGLRCVYHGWKFDVEGHCVDMPSVPSHQDFKDKVSAKAYRVTERAGVVWVYMGAAAKAPPFPEFETLVVPDEEVGVSFVMRSCNFMQALEGDIDTSHFSFLHTGKVEVGHVDPDHPERFQLIDRAPRYHVQATDWGAMYAAYRPAQPGQLYYRFAHFVMPFWTLFPNGPLTDNIIAQAWVPMDDTHVMSFQYAWRHRTQPLSVTRTGAPIPYLERQVATLPNTPDWFGRWVPVANSGNDYLIDRDSQRTVSFTGIASVFGQDSAVTVSMGEISDRTLEHLAPSDRMIVMTRLRLLGAARALRDSGTVPPLVDDPSVSYGARSGDMFAPEDQPWLEAYEETLRQAQHPEMLQAAE